LQNAHYHISHSYNALSTHIKNDSIHLCIDIVDLYLIKIRIMLYYPFYL